MHAVNPTNSNQPQAVPEIPTLEEGRPVIAVRSFGVTDKGKIRPTNEDQFLIAELARILWVRQTSLPQQATHPPAESKVQRKLVPAQPFLAVGSIVSTLAMSLFRWL
jgi:hypothetical protein